VCAPCFGQPNDLAASVGGSQVDLEERIYMKTIMTNDLAKMVIDCITLGPALGVRAEDLFCETVLQE
jgi:hypothetical protein